MKQEIRARSVKAIQKIVKLPPPKKEEKKVPQSTSLKWYNCCQCKEHKVKVDEEEIEIPDTTITPELQKASGEGVSMIKTIAFPSIPALLQDLWVYLELMISILAFALGIRGTFPIDNNEAFQYTYFVLTVINMTLALIDGYIYFVEVGSCARGIRLLKKKFTTAHDKDEDEDDAHLQKKTCCKPEVKEKIQTFFELGRNILTELLLYPLLIFDLFSFEVEQTYEPDDIFDRIDYGLFIIGSFYLVLAVYIMRLAILFGSVISLLRVPKDKSSNSSLIIKFCLHACGQIIVHLMIILIVGAKINNENSSSGNSATFSNGSFANNTATFLNGSSNNTANDAISASPFLWVSIVLGWLLPITGTAAFFIVNYYWVKEFSIEFWVNMMSLLQGASFAETVLGGDGFSETKDKTMEFVENTEYKKVVTQLEKFKSPNWWIKFFFPAKVPVVALCGILYDACLITFIVSLMFTYDGEHVRLIVLQGDAIFTSIFFISVSIIIIANLHIIILLNSMLLILVIILSIFISFSFFILMPLLLLAIFPIFGLFGYCLLLKQLCLSCFKTKNTDPVHVDI